jgi:hypothetical protein
MAQVLRLRRGLAAGLVAAAIGTAPHASAATVSGPGLVTLPDYVVSGSAGAGVVGSVEDPDTGTGATTTGYQNTTLSAPGSTPIHATAAVSCQCSVPGYGWIYSESNATGSVNVSLLPNPSIHATATVGIPPAYPAEGNAEVNAETDYYFEILDGSDPTGHSAVPIVVNAAGGYTYSVDTPGYEEFIQNDVRSSFYVNGIVTDYIAWDTVEEGPLAPGSQSWSDNNTYTMLTNVVYEVGLVAYLDIGMYGGEGGGTQTMSVYVDPTFAVGAVADPSEYSLVFSGGVGNSPASAVPEPSTWAMMLLGFAGLGVAGYRRHRRRAA